MMPRAYCTLVVVSTLVGSGVGKTNGAIQPALNHSALENHQRLKARHEGKKGEYDLVGNPCSLWQISLQ